jgi:hypothetical protein
MLDTYVVSGSAERDTSIAIWESVQTSNSRSTAKKNEIVKPIDIL